MKAAERGSVGRSLACAALAALVLTAATPRQASAHARLVQSDPPKRAALAISPKSIRLWFNEPVEPSFARLTVSNSAGKKFGAPSPAVDAADPKILELAVPELAAGSYAVSYEVVSVDGHRVKGTFSFSVKGPDTKR